LFAVLSALAAGCSSCSGKGGNDASTDTDLDRSTDTDAGSDTGQDADADPPADTSPDPTPDVPSDPGLEPGPWEWEELPEGEDCGPGCRQVTFSDEVRQDEWDVWEDVIVYVDEWGRAHVVDLGAARHVELPSIHPEYSPPPPPIRDFVLHPTTFQHQVYYAWGTGLTPEPIMEIVHADIDETTLVSIWQREYPGSGSAVGLDALDKDVYGDRLVTRGGCGSFDRRNLCYFPLPGPSEPVVLMSGEYGAHNSIWEDVAVWYDFTTYNDIRGYDFAAEEFIEITNDDEYQMMPSIHDRRVVYQDLRHGTSSPSGNWNHCAVYLHDLDSGVSRQITSGEWIAIYPDIFGDIVVWLDWRTCSDPNNIYSSLNVEVWGYNLVTETEFRVTYLPGRVKTTPRIWGEKVFVHMYKAEGSGDAIYMFDLPPEAH
jgi:beta propeller repeat protein